MSSDEPAALTRCVDCGRANCWIDTDGRCEQCQSFYTTGKGSDDE